ncbi:hypothetical protein COCNU_16G001130 [Cocos nucifera]|uniref:Uncharacterized protein n=1 Tax=Cocos nucifera TaxID=13894 RepID=A0A8K0IXW8_COCNU|nr:hypothetical protein COCNU_16G001130 [Cocos nucifera]
MSERRKGDGNWEEDAAVNAATPFDANITETHMASPYATPEWMDIEAPLVDDAPAIALAPNQTPAASPFEATLVVPWLQQLTRTLMRSLPRRYPKRSKVVYFKEEAKTMRHHKAATRIQAIGENTAFFF